ncbi:MAG TPA: DUF72 domain-containing protein [Caulobacteraceae bacterium]|jgi:uncharacterized protein YecE (DUF72 family)|nr:DUF72 domain-containing protein [Caulobacteraceae bacterium]
MSAIRIGTSGWVYRHWRGGFYPQTTPQRLWFEHYAARFSTVELNGSFYKLPTETAVARWRDMAPDGFLFAWKASRFITHMKRLRDAEDSLRRIYAPMQVLGDKLGPCLFQLPPKMPLDLPRLADFLALLPKDRRHVVEFRHPSWFADGVFDALRRHDVALCISDHRDAPAPWIATASFVYVRGHGPGGHYDGSYSAKTLRTWAQALDRWRAESREGFAYFDNDIGCAAPGDAQRLIDALDKAEPARRPSRGPARSAAAEAPALHR